MGEDTQDQASPVIQPATETPNKIVVKSRYTYQVFQRGAYGLPPMFELSFIEADPDKVDAKAMGILKQNVGNTDLYPLKLKSIEVLEDF